ncbi:helix-turn-helix domain-containing protein [Mediterraneibacter faecis]|uniref:helix-turn-helix domain-containing protein n=1 Tax=Mediterraneibacter faecis TaxID=592978 RepID=UPI003F9E945A
MYFNSKKEYVGNKLRELRKGRGLTLNDVGKEIGIKPQTLSNYEKGERSIDIDVLFELAQFYQVSIDYLFGLSGSPTPQRDMFEANELKTVGFSDKAVEQFWECSDFVSFFNELVCHEKFDSFCELIKIVKNFDCKYYDRDYKSFLLTRLLYEMITDIVNSWYANYKSVPLDVPLMPQKELKEKLDKQLKKFLYDNDLMMSLLYINEEEKEDFKDTFLTDEFREFLEDLFHYLAHNGTIRYFGTPNVRISDLQ